MQWVVRRNILTLTVIVPFYNEEKTLESSLIRLKDSKIADEVILIDDCSTDNSLNIASPTGEIDCLITADSSTLL